jgi:UDP-N-acetylmuramate-alanine ligase
MQDLADKIGKKALFLPTLPDVVKYLDTQDFNGNDIIVTMGAGDVYKISKKLKIKS